MFSFFTSVFWVFSLLIAFFHVTDFLYPDCFLLLFCQVLRFCVAVPRVLRVWESFFYPQVLFTLHSFPIFATILQVLWISYRFFYHQAFLTLHSFSTFGTTWCCTDLLSRVLWELAVLLWSCRPSKCGSKHRLDPPVCLNHTVFTKRYYSGGSIYVLRPYGTLYQPLSGFEPTLW